MTEEARPTVTTRGRSPNYPSIGLPAALEAVRKLWATEKRTAVPPDVAAKAMGYGGLSGASRAMLATLRQYGLIGSGDGAVAISDDAVTILVHQPADAEWAEAVNRVARTPDLFRELFEKYPHASDSAINAYLITKRHFAPDAARKAIRAFRDTSSLVSRPESGYTEASNAPVQSVGDNMTAPQASVAQQVQPGQRITVLQFLLGGGARAEVRIIAADEVKPSHLEALEGLLAAQRKAME